MFVYGWPPDTLRMSAPNVQHWFELPLTVESQIYILFRRGLLAFLSLHFSFSISGIFELMTGDQCTLPFSFAG